MDGSEDVTGTDDYDVSLTPHVISQPPPVQGWGGLSHYHIIGTGLIFLAIIIGLVPAVLSLYQIVITKKDAIPERTAYNTIVFCLAAIPSAMSQLYKEHTMTRIRQPIDRNKLNLVLSIFQLLFAVVVSPLAYGLQGESSCCINLCSNLTLTAASYWTTRNGRWTRLDYLISFQTNRRKF